MPEKDPLLADLQPLGELETFIDASVFALIIVSLLTYLPCSSAIA